MQLLHLIRSVNIVQIERKLLNTQLIWLIVA